MALTKNEKNRLRDHDQLLKVYTIKRTVGEITVQEYDEIKQELDKEVEDIYLKYPYLQSKLPKDRQSLKI